MSTKIHLSRKMKTSLMLIWDTLVFFVVYSTLIWTTLYIVGGGAKVVIFLYLCMMELIIFIFHIDPTHKFPIRNEVLLDNAWLYVTGLMVLSMALNLAQPMTDTVQITVTTGQYDLLLQALPFGLGRYFRALAFAEVKQTFESSLVMDALKHFGWLYIASIILTLGASAITSVKIVCRSTTRR